MNLRKRFFFIFSLFFHLAYAVVYGQDELLEIDAASESLVAKLPGISVSSSGVNARSPASGSISFT